MFKVLFNFIKKYNLITKEEIDGFKKLFNFLFKKKEIEPLNCEEYEDPYIQELNNKKKENDNGNLE